MRNIAVFFGGRSNESEISIITGMLAVNLLRGADLQVYPVCLGEKGELFYKADARGVEDFRDLSDKSIVCAALEGNALVRADKKRKKIATLDCALNCCHGGAGEDGTLSALLSWNGLPFASPEMPASAIFMNKEYSQIAAKGLGIPVAPSFSVREEAWRKDKSETLTKGEALGYPLIVKPSTLGSSIGITVARTETELKIALDSAFRLDTGALVEAYFEDKRDINCAAYSLRGETVTSECEEVFSAESILTFAEKYEGTGNTRNSRCPAELPEEASQAIKGYTKLLYETFRLRGIVRADFLYAGGSVYFNELNTVPGSLACYLFGESLTEARDLLVSVLQDRTKQREAQKLTLKTGILERDIFGGGKGCKKS